MLKMGRKHGTGDEWSHKEREFKFKISCLTITGVNGKQMYQCAIQRLNYRWTFGIEPIL